MRLVMELTDVRAWQMSGCGDGTDGCAGVAGEAGGDGAGHVPAAGGAWGPQPSKKKQMKIEAAAAGDKAEKANGPEAANGA